jgi:hypothetical protein
LLSAIPWTQRKMWWHIPQILNLSTRWKWSVLCPGRFTLGTKESPLYPVNRCLADPQNRSDGLEKRKITKLTAKMASVLAKSEWYAAKIAERTTTVYTNLLQLTGLGVHLEYIYNYYCMWKCIIAQPNRIQVLQMHSYWLLLYFTQYKTFQTEILDLHKIIQHV